MKTSYLVIAGIVLLALLCGFAIGGLTTVNVMARAAGPDTTLRASASCVGLLSIGSCNVDAASNAPENSGLTLPKAIGWLAVAALAILACWLAFGGK